MAVGFEATSGAADEDTFHSSKFRKKITWSERADVAPPPLALTWITDGTDYCVAWHFLWYRALKLFDFIYGKKDEEIRWETTEERE